MSEEVPLEDPQVPMEDPLDEIPDDVKSMPSMAIGILLFVIAAAGYYYYAFVMNKKKKPTVEIDETMATNTVSLKDVNYLASRLGPDSTHLDVLMAVASCPDSIKYGLKHHEAREKTRADRIAEEEMEKANEKNKAKSAGNKDMFDFDDEGWADEGDMDDESKRKLELEKKAEEQKKKDREHLDKATGKAKVLLEGIDDGVIGQKWVEDTLASKGVWPPKDLRFLGGEKFDYNGKKVSALEHPGLRRNICMMMGRINSMMLNTHPELLEAGSKQLIDQTYFKGSAEFRQRCAMLLEAALRTAVACRNFELCKTVVQAVSLFKIGCAPPGDAEWFDNQMEKQYKCVPRLEIENQSIECTGENEMATGDTLTLGLDVTRIHAEQFTKQKVAMLQKQGIPPQLALQTYREGWWFLVRAERLDGDIDASTLDLKTDGLLGEVPKSDLEKFEKAAYSERLQTAWPMIVQNITQKTGRVKIQFLAPVVPGKYVFTVSLNSQDFLGADKEITVEGTVLDGATVVRKPKEEKKIEHEDAVEDKKDK
eukprot:CAMPEP_0113617572 /NCGR_PEP_ID=MMETSP0017_2-20120614/8853_1 /TAXON_ID=2856 /ORGANISM="Cylindrotheca closterium" /LENGTH=537 /DNA_ID=CAMNT_0000526979 /DNA_START=70 /DNA_END=1683 /DNA_ORIENTATION=+ /assembly_acc=CAM_ASM_000147